MNFIKLNNSITIDNYVTNKLVNSYGNKVNGKFIGIQYYSLISECKSKIYQLIPERYHNDFIVLLMKINCQIPPHTDSGILSTINIYIKPNDCITRFYSMKEESGIISNKIKNQSNGSIFDESCLNLVSEFKAEINDIWLLDVTVPHSVHSLTNSIDRLAISFQTTKYTFKEVYKMLQETNNLS